MLAIELSKKLGDAPVFGYDIPEWGITGPKSPKVSLLPDEMFLISKHRFRLKNILMLLEREFINGVVIEGWGMRL
jgi:hypothetical protein